MLRIGTTIRYSGWRANVTSNGETKAHDSNGPTREVTFTTPAVRITCAYHRRLLGTSGKTVAQNERKEGQRPRLWTSNTEMVSIGLQLPGGGPGFEEERFREADERARISDTCTRRVSEVIVTKGGAGRNCAARYPSKRGGEERPGPGNDALDRSAGEAATRTRRPASKSVVTPGPCAIVGVARWSPPAKGLPSAALAGLVIRPKLPGERPGQVPRGRNRWRDRNEGTEGKRGGLAFTRADGWAYI